MKINMETTKIHPFDDFLFKKLTSSKKKEKTDIYTFVHVTKNAKQNFMIKGWCQ